MTLWLEIKLLMHNFVFTVWKNIRCNKDSKNIQWIFLYRAIRIWGFVLDNLRAVLTHTVKSVHVEQTHFKWPFSQTLTHISISSSVKERKKMHKALWGPECACLDCLLCLGLNLFVSRRLCTHLWVCIWRRRKERESELEKVTDGSISSPSVGTHYALVMVFATHGRLHSLSFPAARHGIHLFSFSLSLMQYGIKKNNKLPRKPQENALALSTVHLTSEPNHYEVF